MPLQIPHKLLHQSDASRNTLVYQNPHTKIGQLLWPTTQLHTFQETIRVANAKLKWQEITTEQANKVKIQWRRLSQGEEETDTKVEPETTGETDHSQTQS